MHDEAMTRSNLCSMFENKSDSEFSEVLKGNGHAVPRRQCFPDSISLPAFVSHVASGLFCSAARALGRDGVCLFGGDDKDVAFGAKHSQSCISITVTSCGPLY